MRLLNIDHPRSKNNGDLSVLEATYTSYSFDNGGRPSDLPLATKAEFVVVLAISRVWDSFDSKHLELS